MRRRIVVAIIVGFALISVVLNFSLQQHGGQGIVSGAAAKIAVVNIEGLITDDSMTAGLLQQGATTGVLLKQLHSLQEDESIKAVVLRINSPGGSAAASQEIAAEVQKLRAAGKVVVTSIGDMAASGGYWIAAVTDRIVANPSSITGSIGVMMEVQNYAELFDKLGIASDPVKSSEHKDLGSPLRPMTPEERAILQAMVDDTYEQFIAVVVEGRKLPEAKVRELADGRVFTGRQALQAGLIDELGNYYDAIAVAQRLAKTKGKVEIIEMGGQSPFNFFLRSNSSGNEAEILRGLSMLLLDERLYSLTRHGWEGGQ